MWKFIRRHHDFLFSLGLSIFFVVWGLLLFGWPKP